MPNGVGIGSPPAKAWPSGAVWQVLQSPRAARFAPFRIGSGSKRACRLGSIGAISGVHTKAPATAPSATKAATIPPAIAVGRFIGPCVPIIQLTCVAAQRQQCARAMAMVERRAYRRRGALSRIVRNFARDVLSRLELQVHQRIGPEIEPRLDGTLSSELIPTQVVCSVFARILDVDQVDMEIGYLLFDDRHRISNVLGGSI